MSSFYGRYRIVLGRPLVLMLVLAYLSGCSEFKGGKVMNAHADHENSSEARKERPSAHFYLGIGDLVKFRPGRSKNEVLEDIQWRGDFDVAAEYLGNSIYAITYNVLADDGSSERGEVVHAIFVANKFVKFIKWLPGEMEEVPYQGTTWSRPKPTKVGDLSWLVRAVESSSLSAEALQKDVSESTAPRSHVDPGLTLTWLLLQPAFISQYAAHIDDYKENAKLRDQFNAARLEIGMTKAEIESILKAKPFESGMVEVGFYKIYGSNASFNIDPWLHFSNILVVFREGKVIIIRGLPASGDNWRRKLGEGFVDLPAQSMNKP